MYGKMYGRKRSTHDYQANLSGVQGDSAEGSTPMTRSQFCSCTGHKVACPGLAIVRISVIPPAFQLDMRPSQRSVLTVGSHSVLCTVAASRGKSNGFRGKVSKSFCDSTPSPPTTTAHHDFIAVLRHHGLAEQLNQSWVFGDEHASQLRVSRHRRNKISEVPAPQ